MQRKPGKATYDIPKSYCPIALLSMIRRKKVAVMCFLDIEGAFPNAVGAHILICIYAQSQSKYILVFSSIAFLYYFHFTVRTVFQFFLKFSLFLYLSQKACHFKTALLFASFKHPCSRLSCGIKLYNMHCTHLFRHQISHALNRTKLQGWL